MFLFANESSLIQIDDFNLEHVVQLNHKEMKCVILKMLRDKVNWKIVDDRFQCLRMLCSFSSNWWSPLPKLDEIFRPKEIDLLLTDSLDFCETQEGINPQLLIDFILRSGFEDKPELDDAGEPMLRRDTALLWAATHSSKQMVRELFEIYNRYDLNYTDEHHRTHFQVACQYGFDDVVEKFLESGQDPNYHADEYPPLHHALIDSGDTRTIELLLRHERTDPNVTYQHGTTLLHSIVKQRAAGLGVLKLFFRINDELGRTVRMDVVDDWGYTPLVLAVNHGHEETVELLLGRGADPNLALEDGRTKEGQIPLGYALMHGYMSIAKLMLEKGASTNVPNAVGSTALHMICDSMVLVLDPDDNFDVEELVAMIFELDGDNYRTADEIDARDHEGNTPLLLAARHSNATVIESLLRRGANPRLANAERSTCLHLICGRLDGDGIIEPFFEAVGDTEQTVKVDARDKRGRTALHLALRHGNDDAVESLLLNGADPNSADLDGSTPLHVICSKYHRNDYGSAEMFLRIVDQLQTTVRVDARDEKGRTPLQWAVIRCNAYNVHSLLNRGADLSDFVFPTESDLHEQFQLYSRVTPVLTLTVTSNMLAVVGCLEEAGYELELSEALTIMRLFEKYATSETTENLDEFPIILQWVDERRRAEQARFAEMAKEMMVTPSVSLYDLTQLPRDRAIRLVTHWDYFNFEHNNDLWKLPAGPRQACAKHLSEIVSRRFYLEWAMDPFVELIHNRLPLICCDMILEELTNKDLFNICLAYDLSCDD